VARAGRKVIWSPNCYREEGLSEVNRAAAIPIEAGGDHGEEGSERDELDRALAKAMKMRMVAAVR
jgi:hypothetical protein